jgi:hypothetical protein
METLPPALRFLDKPLSKEQQEEVLGVLKHAEAFKCKLSDMQRGMKQAGMNGKARNAKVLASAQKFRNILWNSMAYKAALRRAGLACLLAEERSQFKKAQQKQQAGAAATAEIKMIQRGKRCLNCLTCAKEEKHDPVDQVDLEPYREESVSGPLLPAEHGNELWNRRTAQRGSGGSGSSLASIRVPPESHGLTLEYTGTFYVGYVGSGEQRRRVSMPEHRLVKAAELLLPAVVQDLTGGTLAVATAMVMGTRPQMWRLYLRPVEEAEARERALLERKAQLERVKHLEQLRLALQEERQRRDRRTELFKRNPVAEKLPYLT